MEEQRISRMYLNLAKAKLQAMWDGLFGAEERTGLFPAVVVLVILGITVGVYLAHRHAKFHELRTKMEGNAAAPGAENRPGGRDPVVMTRTQTLGGAVPEFHTVTLLPALGLDVLQITAFLPGRGEVPLLVAPTLGQMTDGSWPKRSGANDVHGALEAPWSGMLTGVTSPTGLTMTAQWSGRMLTVPVQAQQTGERSEGGLLQGQDADFASARPFNAGSELTGQFAVRDFDGHWPSSTTLSVSAVLQATSVELTVDAKNVGDQAEPMGLGWHPRFAIASGRRDQVELTLPDGEKLEVGAGGVPNGKIRAAGVELDRFVGHPAALRGEGVDAAMVPKTLDLGAAAEMRDPAAGYGLRVRGVSASVKELRVTAPAGGGYVSIGTQTNLDDPFGHAWGPDAGAIVTLQPGETMQWKVKLEIFPVAVR